MIFTNYMKHFDEVDGWLSPTTAYFSHIMMLNQTRMGIAGNIVEIGVHNGKYTIPLACGLRVDEKAVGFDVFEDQQENIDNSGRGDRVIFERNFARFLDISQLVSVKANSLNLKPSDITTYGPVRFFSIDGGHTESTTVNDLCLAEKSLAPGGIVALDDILNTRWTGVISGLVRYLAEGGELCPLALVPNKLFLCQRSDVAAYRTLMRSEFADFLDKHNIQMMGSIIDCFEDRPPEYILEPTLVSHAQRKQSLVALQAQAAQLQAEIVQVRAEKAQLLAEKTQLMADLQLLKGSRRFRLGSALAGLIGR